MIGAAVGWGEERGTQTGSIRGKGGRLGAGRGVCGPTGRCVTFLVVCVSVCED